MLWKVDGGAKDGRFVPQDLVALVCMRISNCKHDAAKSNKEAQIHVDQWVASDTVATLEALDSVSPSVGNEF